MPLEGNCRVCGRTYEACEYPLRHSHPTIDNIELDSEGDGVSSLRIRRRDNPLETTVARVEQEFYSSYETPADRKAAFQALQASLEASRG